MRERPMSTVQTQQLPVLPNNNESMRQQHNTHARSTTLTRRHGYAHAHDDDDVLYMRFCCEVVNEITHHTWGRAHTHRKMRWSWSGALVRPPQQQNRAPVPVTLHKHER